MSRDGRDTNPACAGSLGAHEGGVTQSDIVMMFEIIVLVGQLIRERKEIPAGELYSDIMVHWPTLTANGFNAMIQKLIDAKCVKRSNHLLTWVGPEGEAGQ